MSDEPFVTCDHLIPSKGRKKMTNPTGAELIAAERQRQVEAEGWTPEHDDEHGAAELAMAAGCYMWHAVGQTNGVCWPDEEPVVPAEWPWHMDWWKPSDDPVRNLVKAGALIAAEIDRLALAREFGEPGPCGDPECPVLHADPMNPIHPPFYKDSRVEPTDRSACYCGPNGGPHWHTEPT